MNRIAASVILASTLLSSSSFAAKASDKLSFTTEQLQAPISETEIRDTLRKTDLLLPNFKHETNLEYSWTLQLSSQANLIEVKLLLGKIIDSYILADTLESPKKYKRYKEDFALIIAHEYAHILLNQNLLDQSQPFSRFFEERAKASNIQDKDLPENLKSKALIFSGYHELFAETAAFLQSKKPNDMHDLLIRHFGKKISEGVYNRQFVSPELNSLQARWENEMRISSAQGDYNPYSLFWPQKQIIADLVLSKKIARESVLPLLFQVIHEEIESWPKEIKSIDHIAINESFSKKLIKRSREFSHNTQTKKTEKISSLTCSKLFRSGL